MIICQEFRQPVDSPFQLPDFRQVHNPEVIGILPVKAAPLNHQDFLLLQQIQCELLIIVNAEPFSVQLRENIKSCGRFYRRYARDLIQSPANIVTLFVDPAAGQVQRIGLSGILPCGRDQVLGRHVAADPHGSQHVESLDITSDLRFRSA